MKPAQIKNRIEVPVWNNSPVLSFSRQKNIWMNFVSATDKSLQKPVPFVMAETAATPTPLPSGCTTVHFHVSVADAANKEASDSCANFSVNILTVPSACPSLLLRLKKFMTSPTQTS